MAHRLIRSDSTLPVSRRGVRFVALVVLVTAVHGCVTRDLADRMEALAFAARMPPRVAVAYVRTLEPETPPAIAPAPPPPAPKRRAPRPRPAKPASAPEPTVAPEPEALAQAPSASAPVPTLDAAASAPTTEAVAAAASAAPDAAASAPATAIAAASAASAATGVAGTQPFDWPASTRVSFTLTGNYRGEVNGNAQVEWIRVGSRYQVNLDLVVGPDFAPIITRRMTSEGDLTADGLAPSRYDEDTQVVFRDRRRVSIHFQPEGVVLANGQRRERWPGVQDTASQFVQLTYLFTTRPELLKVGGTVEVPLALPRSMDRWIYDVLEEVVIDTSFGPLPTFHLKPRRATPRPGELTAEIWFSPELRYLPVRIRIEQDPQTYLDLVIARKPELAGR